MDTKEFLDVLSSGSTVSGYEYRVRDTIKYAFEEYTDKTSIDSLGNIISIKRGENNDKDIKIMLAAHIDEIGLMVKYIEGNGFIRFTNIGGVDPRTILGQEVIVHGKKDLFGVIGSKPPHLQEAQQLNKAIKLEDMIIDLGYSKEQVEKLVNIGDVITIRRNFKSLSSNSVTGKSLDNKTSVVAMLECAKELDWMNHEADIYFVSTVQEEVGMRGAFTSTYKINPDIGIAIDVGFGHTPELAKHSTLDMGKGPGITIGGNIHPGLREHLVNIAKEYNVNIQQEVTPGPTGTDGRAMQITRQGIPTLCLSIPLRYMHTSVEVANIKDIENTGKLLAFFIASITSENMEGLLCY